MKRRVCKVCCVEKDKQAFALYSPDRPREGRRLICRKCNNRRSRLATIKSVSAVKAAYLAGIVDGEGHVNISRKKNSDVVGGYDYRPQMGVVNTKIQLLTWIKQVTGLGSITEKSTRKDRRHKPAWRWAAWSQQAGQILELIRPYLLLKCKQADIVLAFVDRFGQKNRKGKFGLSPKERRDQRTAFNRLIRLNRRGVP